MNRPTPRPRPPIAGALWVGLWSAAAWMALGVELEAHRHANVFDRVVRLAAALIPPDGGREALVDGLRLSAQTFAIAVVGTAIGAVMGLAAGIAASEQIAAIGARPRGRWSRIRVEGIRLIVDVLRAVPDFGWALVVLVLIGAGPITGVVAIAISVTGLLAKTYSQLLDSAPKHRVETVELSGASPLVVALWGYVPAVSGPMLSYTLLRLECSMRNASVIGVVGGGGLGAALFEELGFGRYDRVATLLLFLLALTWMNDALAKVMARSLKANEGPSRRGWAMGSLVVVLICVGGLGPWWSKAAADLTRLDQAFIAATVDGLLSIDLGLDTTLALVIDAAMPLSLAYWATVIAMTAALGGAVLFPPRWPGSRPPRMMGWGRTVARGVLDGVILMARAIPDIVWLLLFGVVWGMGPLAALMAIALHSWGLLGRLVLEAIDEIPVTVLEARAYGSSRMATIWGLWPELAPALWTHSSLQMESNLRAGLIVGMVGVGGLGDAFHSSITFWRLSEASLQVFAMFGLTVLVDRMARRIARGQLGDEPGRTGY